MNFSNVVDWFSHKQTTNQNVLLGQHNTSCAMGSSCILKTTDDQHKQKSFQNFFPGIKKIQNLDKYSSDVVQKLSKDELKKIITDMGHDVKIVQKVEPEQQVIPDGSDVVIITAQSADYKESNLTPDLLYVNTILPLQIIFTNIFVVRIKNIFFKQNERIN